MYSRSYYRYHPSSFAAVSAAKQSSVNYDDTRGGIFDDAEEEGDIFADAEEGDCRGIRNADKEASSHDPASTTGEGGQGVEDRRVDEEESATGKTVSRPVAMNSAARMVTEAESRERLHDILRKYTPLPTAQARETSFPPGCRVLVHDNSNTGSCRSGTVVRVLQKHGKEPRFLVDVLQPSQRQFLTTRSVLQFAAREKVWLATHSGFVAGSVVASEHDPNDSSSLKYTVRVNQGNSTSVFTQVSPEDLSFRPIEEEAHEQLADDPDGAEEEEDMTKPLDPVKQEEMDHDDRSTEMAQPEAARETSSRPPSLVSSDSTTRQHTTNEQEEIEPIATTPDNMEDPLTEESELNSGAAVPDDCYSRRADNSSVRALPEIHQREDFVPPSPVQSGISQEADGTCMEPSYHDSEESDPPAVTPDDHNMEDHVGDDNEPNPSEAMPDDCLSRRTELPAASTEHSNEIQQQEDFVPPSPVGSGNTELSGGDVAEMGNSATTTTTKEHSCRKIQQKQNVAPPSPLRSGTLEASEVESEAASGIPVASDKMQSSSTVADACQSGAAASNFQQLNLETEKPKAPLPTHPGAKVARTVTDDFDAAEFSTVPPAEKNFKDERNSPQVHSQKKHQFTHSEHVANSDFVGFVSDSRGQQQKKHETSHSDLKANSKFAGFVSSRGQQNRERRSRKRAEKFKQQPAAEQTQQRRHQQHKKQRHSHSSMHHQTRTEHPPFQRSERREPHPAFQSNNGRSTQQHPGQWKAYQATRSMQSGDPRLREPAAQTHRPVFDDPRRSMHRPHRQFESSPPKQQSSSNPGESQMHHRPHPHAPVGHAPHFEHQGSSRRPADPRLAGATGIGDVKIHRREVNGAHKQNPSELRQRNQQTKSKKRKAPESSSASRKSSNSHRQTNGKAPRNSSSSGRHANATKKQRAPQIVLASQALQVAKKKPQQAPKKPPTLLVPGAARYQPATKKKAPTVLIPGASRNQPSIVETRKAAGGAQATAKTAVA